MIKTRIKRISKELDELIKQKQNDLFVNSGEKVSEVSITSMFAQELKKNNVFKRRRKPLL